MPIFTLNDLKTKYSVKPAKEVGIANLIDGERIHSDQRSERTGVKKRKRSRQDGDEDEDGDYCDNLNQGSKEDENDVVGGSKRQKQKQGSSTDGNMNGDGHMTLTPRQMAALHWANKDSKVHTTKRQAAGEKEQSEDIQADPVAGMNQHGGEEAKSNMCDAEALAGKARNCKKRIIGQRLGGH